MKARLMQSYKLYVNITISRNRETENKNQPAYCHSRQKTLYISSTCVCLCVCARARVRHFKRDSIAILWSPSPTVISYAPSYYVFSHQCLCSKNLCYCFALDMMWRAYIYVNIHGSHSMTWQFYGITLTATFICL